MFPHRKGNHNQNKSNGRQPLALLWARQPTYMKILYGLAILFAITGALALIGSGVLTLAGIDLLLYLTPKLIMFGGVGLGLTTLFVTGRLSPQNPSWLFYLSSILTIAAAATLIATGAGAIFGLPLLFIVASELTIVLGIGLGLPLLLGGLYSAKETIVRDLCCCVSDDANESNDEQFIWLQSQNPNQSSTHPNQSSTHPNQSYYYDPNNQDLSSAYQSSFPHYGYQPVSQNISSPPHAQPYSQSYLNYPSAPPFSQNGGSFYSHHDHTQQPTTPSAPPPGLTGSGVDTTPFSPQAYLPETSQYGIPGVNPRYFS